MSPVRPSFSPQPRVYPRSSLLLTAHHPLFTFPRPFFSNTYELPLPTHRFLAPLFAWSYGLLFSQTLCFENDLRCPIVFSALPRNSASSANSEVDKPLTRLLTYCCGLSGFATKLNSFAIKQIKTLLTKHPGWGCPDDASAHSAAL